MKGPTNVKFGQALSARADVIPKSLVRALSTLQDDMQPFDTSVAQDVIRTELKTIRTWKPLVVAENGTTSEGEPIVMTSTDLEELVQSLTAEPVAAASLRQVYSAYLPIRSGQSPQKVAIKVNRPGIDKLVEQDAALLQSTVSILESIHAIPYFQEGQERCIEAELIEAVDEFMSRILELDYQDEARNIARFFRLYSHRRVQREKQKVRIVI